MSRVLLTAFEPYDEWSANASWLAVQHLTRDLPTSPQVTTRLYPVDFSLLRERLVGDLRENFDVALMLGQAPGATAIAFESIGVNAAVARGSLAEDAAPLAADCPTAYRSDLPLGDWSRRLREAGIPAQVSHHAGTFLCNAAMYLAHYFIERMSLPTRATFIHVPLDVSQAVDVASPPAAMPVEITAESLRLVLSWLKAPVS